MAKYSIRADGKICNAENDYKNYKNLFQVKTKKSTAAL